MFVFFKMENVRKITEQMTAYKVPFISDYTKNTKIKMWKPYVYFIAVFQ